MTEYLYIYSIDYRNTTGMPHLKITSDQIVSVNLQLQFGPNRQTF